jgi:HD-like signal output (HDOD) protein
MVTQEQITKKLKQIDILPTFPKIVSSILALIDDPMSSASDLARHMDPSMTGEILRIANTAYFGTRSYRSIQTIERAIAVIGYEHLAYVVLQMPFLGLLQKSDTTFDRDQFITHAVVSGILAKTIGVSSSSPVDHNEIYISGILHDVGKIIMYRYFRKEWEQVNALIRDKHVVALDAEMEVFSAHHSDIGASLLGIWNLPPAIVDGVRYHHAPDAAEENRESAVATSLADQFAKMIDLKLDLVSFDDFAVRHRDFCQVIAESVCTPMAQDEIKFLSLAFDSLRSAKRLIDVTTGEDSVADESGSESGSGD